MMGIRQDLLLWFINFLIKSGKGLVLLIMRLNKIYNQLKNYTKQLLETLKKEQFILNILGADLADMQLISNKGFRFLLCVLDIISKYAWVVPLKDKNGVSINAFKKCQMI